MVSRANKSASRRKAKGKSEILESITGSDALSILHVLAERDEQVKTTIEKTAVEILGTVDVDEIASAVQMTLEFLHVEDVWDRAGATRDGYLDPGDVAWEMIEDVTEQNLMTLYVESMSNSTPTMSSAPTVTNGFFFLSGDRTLEAVTRSGNILMYFSSGIWAKLLASFS